MKALRVVISPPDQKIKLLSLPSPLEIFCSRQWREVPRPCEKCRILANFIDPSNMEPVDTKPTEHEYETQFFGFTPESFVDGG